MGSFFSSSAATSTSGQPDTAKVINADGLLTEYSEPIKVSHVLGLHHHSFLCNADELFYGHHIQALDDNDLVELGKLYFFLPVKRLKRPLTAGEMVALAVSASSALADATLERSKMRSNGSRRWKGVQVRPVISAMECERYESFNESSVRSWGTEKGRRKSDEVKQRTSRRGDGGGVVERTFWPRLSSIEEVNE